MLEEIMKKQAEFQFRTPDGVKDLKEIADEEMLMSMTRTQILACIAELVEALDEIGWKPWTSSNHFNVEAFRSELIDAFRFWLNLVHISGMSAKDVLNKFNESLEKTNRRVEHGYDGLNKCPACHRAYDDKHMRCKKEPKDSLVQDADKAFMAGISYCQVYGYINREGKQMMVANGTWVLG
jgi:dUTPase-like protein